MPKQVDIPYCNQLVKQQLDKIKLRVLTKDRDWVAVYDGEEGAGKSVLAMQHAKLLDPNFCLDNVVFTADDFMNKIRDPNTKKGACIVLDEGFNAANSRAALTEVNRSMIALATEMRQKNLFVLIVLPTFFDLDRYFAIWRCRALFHVYFTPEDERRYIVFDKNSKKLLYLKGKKTYNYTYPKSSFPPAAFYDQYVLDEEEYRLKKAKAFSKRKVSNQSKIWIQQRDSLIMELVDKFRYTETQISNAMKSRGTKGLSSAKISNIRSSYTALEDDTPKESGFLPLISSPYNKTNRLTE